MEFERSHQDASGSAFDEIANSHSSSSSSSISNVIRACPSQFVCISDHLDPHERIESNEFICSPDGRHRFGLADADLSLWDGSAKVWSGFTCCEDTTDPRLAMQGDGNAVVYADDGSGSGQTRVLWASNTAGNVGAYLILGDDGIPHIIHDGSVLWKPDSCGYLMREPLPPGPSPPGLINVDATTLFGRVMAGYQGWFGTTCEGEGGLNEWRHWSANGQTPGPGNYEADMWPDLREYEPDELCGTDFVYPDGRCAGLFSSWTAPTVERHVRWMHEYGIDGAFVQRFIREAKTMRCFRDRILETVRRGSEQYGRVFTNMYDISGGDSETMYQDIKKDWMYLVDIVKVTESDRYLRHNGLPVLAIWGFGFRTRPGEPAKVLELMDWLKNNTEHKYRVTLMGGVPAYWRTLTKDSKADPAWAQVYRSFDIISPWAVGRYKDDVGADNFRTNCIEPDLAECQRYEIDYFPVVFPGYSHSNSNPDKIFNEIPRRGGKFFWHQIYNAVDAGSTQMYVAMFDEVDEATAIFKTAETPADTPTEGNFVTLDQDGFDVPSDSYLYLTGNATEMLRADGKVPAIMPALPSFQAAPTHTPSLPPSHVGPTVKPALQSSQASLGAKMNLVACSNALSLAILVVTGSFL